MPGVQVGNGAIGSEIELEGRDRDVAFRQRAHIRAALIRMVRNAATTIF